MSLKSYVPLTIMAVFTVFFVPEVSASFHPDSVDHVQATPPSPLAEVVVGCEYGTSRLYGQNIRVFNLGEKINSDYAEYNQVLNQAEGFMLFTARRDTTTGEDRDSQDGQYFEDIMISQKVDGRFQTAKKLEDAQDLFPYSINTKKHEAPVFLGWDEQQLIIFKEDKLWYSARTDSGFAEPMLYEEHVNIDKYQRHASFTEDGKTIYFSSEVKDSKTSNFHFDLFVTRQDNEGNWSKPEPLPFPINTLYNEDSPEISKDGKTMYFSSSRLGGLGGYDIYLSNFENGTWTDPVNLCEPINSPAQDIYFKPSRDGTTAYFSSDRLGGYGSMDIYKVVLDVPTFADCRDYKIPQEGEERYLTMLGTDTIITNTPFVIDGGDSKLDGKTPNNWYWKIKDLQVKNTSTLEQIIDSSSVFEVSMEISVIDEERLEARYACVTKKYVAVRPEDRQDKIAARGVELSNLMSDNEILVKLDNQLTANPLSLTNDVYETQMNTRIPVNVLENDIHPRNLDLEVVSISSSVNGSLLVTNATSGDAMYTPAKDFVGVDQFKYTAKDSTGLQSEAFVVIKVLNEEQLMAGQLAMNDYGQTQKDTAIEFNLLVNDTSYSGSSLQIEGLTSATNGTAEIVNAQTGEIRYTPNPGYVGADAFTYTVIGADGQRNTALVKINVVGDDAGLPAVPSTENDLRRIFQNQTASVNVFDNDALDVWPMAYLSAVTNPENGNVKIVDANKGVILYVPPKGFTGTETFTYTVSNELGQRVVEGVTIIVLPDERLYALKLEPDFDTTMTGRTVQTNILSNDRHQQGLGMKVWKLGQPANGKVELTDAENGWIAYTSNAEFTGKDVFQYVAVDELGTKARALVTIEVIGGEETLLLLADDAGETREGEMIELNLLANDEAFGDATISLVELGSPENGKASIISASDGTISYTPNIGFTGIESFIYKAEDSKGNVATAKVVITVKPAISIASVETENLPTLELKPIYFDFDKSYIRKREHETMAYNIQVLKDNPEVIIKVLSHCDSRGSIRYNIGLSDRRARSTVAYLVKNGISKERIIASVGLGESQLVNDCGDGVPCPPQDHQLNRRSDFVVVGKVKE